MATRPQNHVTRAADARRANLETQSPGPGLIPDRVIDYYAAAYPPRCIRPGETLEDHLRYAGKVDLVEAMRSHNDLYRRPDADPQPGRAEPDEGTLAADAEHVQNVFQPPIPAQGSG
jgi:hypothetical protein